MTFEPPHGRYSIDILTRLGEAFRFDDIESEELQIDDFTVRVATPQMLYRMKKDTVRPQDRADAAPFETASACARSEDFVLRKYRSVQEMPPVARLEPGDPDNLRIACELSEFACALRPWRFARGVRKFRSIEDASEWRAEWERLQVRR